MSNRNEPVPVVLVCMPWSLAARPSIALGTLKSVLDREGIASEVLSYHLAFAEHLATATAGHERPLRLADYERIAGELTSVGAGDWTFAVPPYRAHDPDRDDAYFTFLRAEMEERQVDLLARVRTLVPAFLERCADEILAANPRIVGFTSTFCQNIPSLALALILKQRAPGLTIVLGGSSCDGPMGAALHASHPWVDVVVRGEGEHVFPRLVREILSGAEPSEQPGLCFRRGDRAVVVPESGPSVNMDDVPTPDYDEYFARVRDSPIQTDLRSEVRIPYESARGCWWGAKSHCTFCGLNGASMRFRSKSPARVVEEITGLAGRHQNLHFYVVDNILDMGYFDTALPALAATGWDLSLFVETKSNLRLEHVRTLHEAGIGAIQPGIESLSTPILKLMRKGVTALQNIRLLKWCASYRIRVLWNLIYGFPGEPPEEYARMAKEMESLTHLEAPNSGRLRVDRFSPYFNDQPRLGLRVTGPQPFYRHIYDVDDATLRDLAYFFDAEHVDGRDPNNYVGPVRDAIARWKQNEGQSYRSLTFRLGPGFVIIDDQRPALGPARYVLEAREAALYLACEAGATPAAVRRSLAPDLARSLSEGDIRGFLDDLVDARLIYREGDRYLSLAVAADPAVLEQIALRSGPERDESGATQSLGQLRQLGRAAAPIGTACHD